MRKIPPTHPKITLWPVEWTACMGTWESWTETTLAWGRIRATLWVGGERQNGGEREKSTAGRVRGCERLIKPFKKSLLIPSLLSIGTVDWTQALGKALPLRCTQPRSTLYAAHTEVLPPTKPLRSSFCIYFSLETHHTSDIISPWGLNSFQVDWLRPKTFLWIYKVYLWFIKQHTRLKWLETKW